MNKYFKLDSRKVTYGEYWNILHSWTVIIPWMAKVLNIPMNFSSGLPYFESLNELEVPEEQFTARAREKLQTNVDICQGMGFQVALYCRYESMHRDTGTSFITMMHPSGVAARLTYTVSLKVQPPKEKLEFFVLSELRDGTFLLSTSRRQHFLTAPGIIANRLVGASAENVIQSHFQKLAELALSNPAKTVNSAADAIDVFDRYEKRVNDFGFRRGIYVWMNPEETALGQQHLVEAKTMAAGNEQDVGVLIELNKLQNRKASWTGMAVLFVVSLVLFVGAGTRRWSMNYLIILVGVVFVHELGHYLAMRTFNYRNLRMFFIPFFGAAVSGRHYNVPGWKKAIVSLMGPLPGIYLGLFIGGLGWYLHIRILYRIAIVSLLLNGSNLLPVLPLDGGWVFHSLVFSRHYILDVVFRALAAVILIVGSAFLKIKSLMYVGILMLITLPVTYRMVRVAAALKRRGFEPVSADSQTIPSATALAIIGEVKRSTRKPQSNKSVAQQTLQIFEMLNASPPGWGATIGLLFIQLASITIAAAFAVVFFLGQNRALLGVLNTMKQVPSHKLVLEQSQIWPTEPGNGVPGQSGVILVGTFRDSASAALAFEDFTNRLPSNAVLKLFGDSLLLSLPSNDDGLQQHWLSELQHRAKDAFEDSTNSHAAFSLSCAASDTNAAEALVNELNGYFDTLPAELLVPPWQPGDMRSSRERAANDLARQTWLKLAKVAEDIESDTNLDALENKLELAQDGGRTNVASLQSQIATLRETLYRQNIAGLQNGEQGALDTNVLNLFIVINSGEAGTNQLQVGGARREVAQRMGRLSPARGADRFCAQTGFVERSGQIIKLSFISFNRNDDGPLALAAWLRDEGCGNFKYIFLPGMGSDDSD
jgi:Zn-dependent protease